MALKSIAIWNLTPIDNVYMKLLQNHQNTEIQQTDAMQSDACAKYSISDRIAEKGGHFYQNSEGKIDLVILPEAVTDKIGVANIPFRLTISMANHVFEQHKKEGHFKTVQDAIKFAVTVMTSFDHVRKGDDKGTYVFSIENNRTSTGKRAVTIILTSESGNYFGLKTSGYERIENIKKRPLIWEKSVETSATDTASANVTSGSAIQGGKQSGNASIQKQ